MTPSTAFHTCSGTKVALEPLPTRPREPGPGWGRQLRVPQTGNLLPFGWVFGLWGPGRVSSLVGSTSLSSRYPLKIGGAIGPAPRLSCVPARGGGNRCGARRGRGTWGRHSLPSRWPQGNSSQCSGRGGVSNSTFNWKHHPAGELCARLRGGAFTLIFCGIWKFAGFEE